jgi:putative SOS response-associated peptidase YedK
MCGRYYIEIDEKELQDIVDAVEKNIKEYPEQTTIKMSGEIFPTDIVPVQTGLNRYAAMKWGFVGFDGKPLINARSETALEKPMFRQAMLERRCLIPASG